MRIVQFTFVGVVPDYSIYAGGKDAFGYTEITGNTVVGEYSGNATEEELATYVGDFSRPVSYRTSLSVTEFKAQFTGAEYLAISNAAATDPDLYQFWDIAQTAADVQMDHPITIGGMNYILFLDLITAERHAVIMQGVVDE